MPHFQIIHLLFLYRLLFCPARAETSVMYYLKHRRLTFFHCRNFLMVPHSSSLACQRPFICLGRHLNKEGNTTVPTKPRSTSLESHRDSLLDCTWNTHIKLIKAFQMFHVCHTASAYVYAYDIYCPISKLFRLPFGHFTHSKRS